MKDFKDIDDKINESNLEKIISQKRIFNIVTGALKAGNEELLRLYVSGEGRTGKSFFIYAIRAWVKNELQEMRVAVSAPTVIAAYNI